MTFHKLGLVAALIAGALCAACGGGGGGGGGGLPSSTVGGGATGTLPASSTLANQCAPTNTLAPAGQRTASLERERQFVRSYVDEAYLWYREVPNVNGTAAQFNNPNDVFGSLEAYLDALRTPALTASGRRRDQFSFAFPTAEWNALSQAGTTAGFGAEWFLASATPPRNIRVAYVDPNTPAADAGVGRGFALVSVNGVSADDNTAGGIAVLNQALFAPTSGTSYAFVLRDINGATGTYNLTAGTITKTPVQNTRVIDSGGVKVGYLTFNDFILPAESQLATAFSTLAQQNVTELVLDLRYNGGGFLYQAAQIGYMIAGATRSANKVFERPLYNDKRTAESNDPNNIFPFINVATGAPGTGTTANAALPQLNLARVFILVTGSSCSASESVINGLRGIDVEVVLIGSTTCGKPYAFTAKDNCGISYFPVEFQGVNQKGFGDFADGFAPNCRVSDDFSRALGDASEAMLAAALTYRTTGACPAGTGVQAARAQASTQQGFMARHPVRESAYR